MTTGTHETSSTNMSGGGERATSGGERGGESAVAQQGQSGDVQECEDQLEALREAMGQSDAEAAWSAYGQLDDAQRSQLGEEDVVALVGLFYPNFGLAAIQNVFTDFGVTSLRAQLEVCNDASILDATSLDELLNPPGVSAEDQRDVAGDDALVAVIISAAGDLMPHDVFRTLAGAPSQFIDACRDPGPMAEWVDQDDETLFAVTNAVVDYAGWASAIEGHSAHDRLLLLASTDDHTADWRAGLLAGPGYNWLVQAVDKPISDDTLAKGLFNLYGDGSGINDADKVTTWDALYNADLKSSGDNLVIEWDAGSADFYDRTRRTVYVALDPTGATMDLFFQTYKQIPRSHIDTASVVVMSHDRYRSQTKHRDGASIGGYEIWPEETIEEFMDTDWNAVANQAAATEDMGTSYYNSFANSIMIYSTSTVSGVADTGTISEVGTGDGRDAIGAGASWFENHAAHEVGHAVGNKRLVKDGIDDTGDNYAKNYAEWAQNGDATGYARQHGWTATHDATSYTLSHGPTTEDVLGLFVRNYLTGIVDGSGAGWVNSVESNFGANGLDAIKSNAVLAGHALVQCVDAIKGIVPGEAYQLRQGVPSAQGGKVHLYSTRWGDSWCTIKESAWNEKVSHYSVSSFKEMFAEIYTERYTGGGVPGGMQPFFDALDDAEPEDFPDLAGGGGGGGAGPAPGGGDDGTRPWP